MEILHHIEHTFFDSLKMLPVLFIVYLVIELLEHKNNNIVHHLFMKTKKSGPLVGGLFGCIPQCGFSVIASDLYAKGNITKGTLIAVFISTSDEAIPILFSEPGKMKVVLPLIVLKFICAIAVGFLVDVITRPGKESVKCEHSHHEHHHYHGNCESCSDGIVKSAIIHAVRIFAFVFVISFIIDFALENIEGVFDFVAGYPFIAPFITPIIGLIPSCGASVLLTELYVSGAINLGALTGGLCAGAGVGLTVLLKANKNMKDNLKIISVLYVTGVISAFIITYFA